MTGFGSVILADGQLAAAEVALAFHFGRIGHDVERLAAILAGPASGHALDYRLVRYLDRQRAVDIDTCLLKRFGLRDGSGHTVEDIAVFAVGLGKALVDDADNDIVGNELAAFHIRLSLQTYGVPFFMAARRILPVEMVGIESMRLSISA